MAKHTTAPTPHIQAQVGEIAETVLLPGDPLRAKFIADTYLENVKQFNATRNMFGFTGTYKGRPVSVMGTGMGCPSMGIYSYELIHIYGCKNLIRIGTAGAIQPFVHAREMVFGMGSCTNSNYVAQQGLPGDFCPICSFELLERRSPAPRPWATKYHVGNISSGDTFTAWTCLTARPGPRWACWRARWSPPPSTPTRPPRASTPCASSPFRTGRRRSPLPKSGRPLSPR